MVIMCCESKDFGVQYLSKDLGVRGLAMAEIMVMDSY